MFLHGIFLINYKLLHLENWKNHLPTLIRKNFFTCNMQTGLGEQLCNLWTKENPKIVPNLGIHSFKNFLPKNTHANKNEWGKKEG